MITIFDGTVRIGQTRLFWARCFFDPWERDASGQNTLAIVVCMPYRQETRWNYQPCTSARDQLAAPACAGKKGNDTTWPR